LKRRKKNKEDSSDYHSKDDKNGFWKLAHIAAEATKRGYERAKKSSREIILVEKGSVVVKKNEKSIKVISKLNERAVEVGTKQIFL